MRRPGARAAGVGADSMHVWTPVAFSCVKAPVNCAAVARKKKFIHAESHMTFAPYLSILTTHYTEDSVKASAPNNPVDCTAGTLQSTNPTSLHTSTHHVALLKLKRTQCTEACNGTRNRTASAATPSNRASAAHRPVAIHKANAAACAISHKAH
jgi:hypothetical protein